MAPSPSAAAVLVYEQPDLLFLDEVAEDFQVDPGEHHQAAQLGCHLKPGTIADALSPTTPPVYKVGVATIPFKGWGVYWLVFNLASCRVPPSQR